MFICEDCGAIFSEPKIEYETHGLPCPPYERWEYCPHCESTNFNEAKHCTRCDEYVTELHNGVCDICYDDLYG